jgi:hypothetical protein
MKIISGGQTGVDRAALDAAIEVGIAHGGWCPLGRLAEDGRIPDCYQLCETDSPEYAVRTERNVAESDATLILFRARISGKGDSPHLCAAPSGPFRQMGTVPFSGISGGTELTLRLAGRHGRPHLAVDLDAARNVSGTLRVPKTDGTRSVPDTIAGPAEVRRWLKEERVEVLNVAGPRESQSPGIGALAREFLVTVFRG